MAIMLNLVKLNIRDGRIDGLEKRFKTSTYSPIPLRSRVFGFLLNPLFNVILIHSVLGLLCNLHCIVYRVSDTSIIGDLKAVDIRTINITLSNNLQSGLSINTFFKFEWTYHFQPQTLTFWSQMNAEHAVVPHISTSSKQ